MSQSVETVTATRTRYKVLWLLFALSVITFIDRLCISAAAPAIIQEFNLSPSQMGYVFSAFTLAYAIFEVPGGWLGDYIGTRKTLTRIVLCWSAFTALTGAALGFVSLLVVRILFGAGEAGAFPNIARSIARWFPSSEQGRALSVAFLGLATGSAITTPLVFKLIEVQNWRLVFVEAGALGVIWCVIWYRWFRDDPEDHPSVNTAELSLIRSHSAAKHHRAAIHVPWARLFKSANLGLVCGMYFASGYGFYFYITWLPTYLLKARGFSTAHAGFFSALPWVLSAGAFWLGGWLTDWLVRRTGNLRISRCGLGAVGYLASAVVLVGVANAHDRIVAALLIALAVCIQMLTVSAAWSVCLDIGRQHAGVVTGFMNMFGNLGGTVAPLVVGYTVERWGSWTFPFYASAGVFIAGMIMWLLINPQRPLIDEESVI